MKEMARPWLLLALSVMTLSVTLCSLVNVCAGQGRPAPTDGRKDRDEGAASGLPRGDAMSDPLLLLLRAPAIRQHLALRGQQVESLDNLISEVDSPLWQLRDAQFLSEEHSKKAWQLVDQTESKLADVLQREQLTRFRQLVLQARGIQGLLSSDAVQGLKLSPDQVHQIVGIFEATRSETKKLQHDPAGKRDEERAKQVESLVAAERTKVVALLSDDQKQRWRQLSGTPYDFQRLPRRFVRAPEIRAVDEWINTSPLTLRDLRGKVVVLHFFTFGCINCIHNQPAYKAWHERFSRQDAVVLGIHSPEGESDRKLESIRKAMQDQGIAYPVAVDSAKENWNAWGNHTWPSVYLIDKAGYVRWWWYGELNWQDAQGEKRFGKKIADLLAEDQEPIRSATNQAAPRSGGRAP